MTWGFFFLTFLLVGIVLAGVFGILESLTGSGGAPPRAELLRHRRQIHVARLGVALAGFGGCGLILFHWGGFAIPTVVVASFLVGLLSWGASRWVFRLPCLPSPYLQKATVVREIPPGGYGQVQVEAQGLLTVLAAQSEDEEAIPVGSQVEVVDCQRSVVVVRKVPSPQ